MSDITSEWHARIYSGDFTDADRQASTIEQNRKLVRELHASSLILNDLGLTGQNDFGLVASLHFIAPASGNYTFWTASDDGSTLHIQDLTTGRLVKFANENNQILDFLDNDRHQPETKRSATAQLVQGIEYKLTARYWENAGSEIFKVGVTLPSGKELDLTGKGWSKADQSATVAISEWHTKIYSGDFTDADRQASTIEQNRKLVRELHASSLILNDLGLTGQNDFGLVASLHFIAPASGNYTFWTASDDGSTLHIQDLTTGRLVKFANENNQILDFLDNDRHQPETKRSATAQLVQGIEYKLTARYWENAGSEIFKVGVTLPSGKELDLTGKGWSTADQSSTVAQYVIMWIGVSHAGFMKAIQIRLKDDATTDAVTLELLQAKYIPLTEMGINFNFDVSGEPAPLATSGSQDGYGLSSQHLNITQGMGYVGTGVNILARGTKLADLSLDKLNFVMQGGWINATPAAIISNPIKVGAAQTESSSYLDTALSPTFDDATWRVKIYRGDFTSADGQASTIEVNRTLIEERRSTPLSLDKLGIGDDDDIGFIANLQFVAPTTGTYTFWTSSADGSTVDIRDLNSGKRINFTNEDGRVLDYLDNDKEQPKTTRSATIELIQGVGYNLTTRYWENAGSNEFNVGVRLPSGKELDLTAAGWEGVDQKPYISGRYVMIYKNYNSRIPLAIKELQIFDENGKNIALNKTYVTPVWAKGAEYAIDGVNTDIQSLQYFHCDQFTGTPYYQLDLGSTQEISKINIHGIEDNALNGNLSVYVSNQPMVVYTVDKDKKSWFAYTYDQIKAKSDFLYTVNSQTELASIEASHFKQRAAIGKYSTILIKKDPDIKNHLSISELEIVDINGVNITNKAKQIIASKAAPGFDLGFLSNGVTLGSKVYGGVWASETTQEGWVEVTFDQPVDISHVNIFGRSDSSENSSWFRQNGDYTIYFSNKSINAVKQAELKRDADVKYYEQKGNGPRKVTIDGSILEQAMSSPEPSASTKTKSELDLLLATEQYSKITWQDLEKKFDGKYYYTYLSDSQIARLDKRTIDSLHDNMVFLATERETINPSSNEYAHLTANYTHKPANLEEVANELLLILKKFKSVDVSSIADTHARSVAEQAKNSAIIDTDNLIKTWNALYQKVREGSHSDLKILSGDDPRLGNLTNTGEMAVLIQNFNLQYERVFEYYERQFFGEIFGYSPNTSSDTSHLLAQYFEGHVDLNDLYSVSSKTFNRHYFSDAANILTDISSSVESSLKDMQVLVSSIANRAPSGEGVVTLTAYAQNTLTDISTLINKLMHTKEGILSVLNDKIQNALDYKNPYTGIGPDENAINWHLNGKPNGLQIGNWKVGSKSNLTYSEAYGEILIGAYDAAINYLDSYNLSMQQVYQNKHFEDIKTAHEAMLKSITMWLDFFGSGINAFLTPTINAINIFTRTVIKPIIEKTPSGELGDPLVIDSETYIKDTTTAFTDMRNDFESSLSFDLLPAVAKRQDDLLHKMANLLQDVQNKLGHQRLDTPLFERTFNISPPPYAWERKFDFSLDNVTNYLQKELGRDFSYINPVTGDLEFLDFDVNVFDETFANPKYSEVHNSWYISNPYEYVATFDVDLPGMRGSVMQLTTRNFVAGPEIELALYGGVIG